MENQVTNEVVKEVAETSVEAVKATPINGKGMLYIALGAGLAVGTVVAVKKGKKVIKNYKDNKALKDKTFSVEAKDEK